MNKKLAYAIAALLAALLFAVVAGCGDDGDASSGDAAATDDAFLAAMTAHHDDAIEMAEIARSEAEHEEVRGLAREVVAAQSDEIEQMDEMHQRMFDAPVSHADHGAMGMEEHEMGMSMAPMELQGADPFDREFIDAMIAHHQGAIRMAEIVIEQGADPEIESMAEAIIDAQSGEIDEMNQWRERWYGSGSPAGGVPEEMHRDEMPMHDEMGH